MTTHGKHNNDNTISEKDGHGNLLLWPADQFGGANVQQVCNGDGRANDFREKERAAAWLSGFYAQKTRESALAWLDATSSECRAAALRERGRMKDIRLQQSDFFDYIKTLIA